MLVQQQLLDLGDPPTSMKNPATLPNPDPVKCPIQRIQSFKERFCLSFPPVSPEAFGHSVQGLDRPFNVCSACWWEVFLRLLCHCQNFYIACA